MKDLRSVGFVGCFLFGATASAFGVASPASDISESEPVQIPLPASSAPERAAVQRAQPQPPRGNPLWGIPLKQLSATRERPIFSPSRRPPTPAVAAPPAAAQAIATESKLKEPDRPQLALLGTIVGGDDGFGIFLDQTTKLPLRIRLGTAYQGWTLRSLRPGLATLMKGQQTAAFAFPKPVDEKQDPGRLAAGAAPMPAPRPGLMRPTPPPNAPPQATSFRVPVRPPANPLQRP